MQCSMQCGWRLVAAAAVVLAFGVSGVAGAGEDAEHFALRARLLPVDDPPGAESAETEAHGHAWLRTLSEADRSRSRFKAKLELPLASEALVLDTCDVDMTEVRLVLSRDDAELARCTLVPAEVDLLEEEIEFEVDIRQRNGTLEDRAGSCDPAGIPELREGDVATAFLLDGVETLLAEGVFVVKD